MTGIQAHKKIKKSDKKICDLIEFCRGNGLPKLTKTVVHEYFLIGETASKYLKGIAINRPSKYGYAVRYGEFLGLSEEFLSGKKKV